MSFDLDFFDDDLTVASAVSIQHGASLAALEAAVYMPADQSTLKPVLDFNPSNQFLIPTVYESSEGGIRNISIFICGVIDSTPRYLNAVARIEALLPSLTDRDVVSFYISSPGGRVNTATKITSAMKTCKAHIKTIAYGMIASAATLIWSHGDELVICPGQAAMVHMSSHGDMDNTNRIAARANFLKTYITRIAITNLHQKGLLSDEQVERITENGEDIYILSDNQVFIGHSESLNDVPEDADPSADQEKVIPEASKEEAASSRKQQDEVDKLNDGKSVEDTPPKKEKEEDTTEESPEEETSKEEDTEPEEDEAEKKEKKAATAMIGTEAFIETPTPITPCIAPYHFPNIEKDTRTGYYNVTIPSYTYNINTYSNALVGVEHFMLTRSEQDTIMLKVAYMEKSGSTGIPLTMISAMKQSKAKIVVVADTMHDDSFSYLVACADHHVITDFGCIVLSGKPSGDDYYRHGAYLEHAFNWAFKEMALLNDEERKSVRNGRVIMIDAPDLMSRSSPENQAA